MSEIKIRKPILREQRCWELRAQGRAQAEIAAELGVRQSTVSRILSRLLASYAENLRADVAAAQDAQICRLEHTATEAMRAWEASKGQAVTEVTRYLPPEGDKLGPGAVAEVTRRVVHQAGNPAYLREAREALANIRKILGLDAAGPAPAAPVDGLENMKFYVGVDIDRI